MEVEDLAYGGTRWIATVADAPLQGRNRVLLLESPLPLLEERLSPLAKWILPLVKLISPVLEWIVPLVKWISPLVNWIPPRVERISPWVKCDFPMENRGEGTENPVLAVEIEENIQQEPENLDDRPGKVFENAKALSSLTHQSFSKRTNKMPAARLFTKKPNALRLTAVNERRSVNFSPEPPLAKDWQIRQIDRRNAWMRYRAMRKGQQVEPGIIV